MGFEACPDLTNWCRPEGPLDARRLRSQADFPAFPALPLPAPSLWYHRHSPLRAGLEHSEKWTTELIGGFLPNDHLPLPHSVEGCFDRPTTPFPGSTMKPILPRGAQTHHLSMQAWELNATGFMHNRVRMVVASFLCKHLLTDWRWGERYSRRNFDLTSPPTWADGSGQDRAAMRRRISAYSIPLRSSRNSTRNCATSANGFRNTGSSRPEAHRRTQTARQRAIDTYQSVLCPVCNLAPWAHWNRSRIGAGKRPCDPWPEPNWPTGRPRDQSGTPAAR